MSKITVLITAQYSENYGDLKNPTWKLKGGHLFSLKAESDSFMYAHDECVNAIKKLLLNKSNEMCRFDYVKHELITNGIEPLDETEFDALLTAEFK